MEIEDAILSECSAIDAVKSLHEQINMRDTNIMLLKKKIMDSMPVVQLYHETKLESDKLLKEITILKEENSKNEESLRKSLIENLALNKVHDEVSKKHEVMQVEYDELLLKSKGQAFHIKQLKNLTASLETKIEAGIVDAQLINENHKDELAKSKAENVTLQKTISRLNSASEKKILHLYDFISFLGGSVASGTLSKPQRQKLKRCKVLAELIRSKSHTAGEENILEDIDVDESSALDVDESHGPFSCASSVDMGLGSSVCTSDDEKYPSTATTPTRDSCVSPAPPSFAFTLPTSDKLTYLPKQYTDASTSTSPLQIKTTTVGSDPICLERKITKVNVATSPIKELQIDNLRPAQPMDDIEIEDSTVRDILSKTSHPIKIVSPIPFNEAMDSKVDSLPVAEVVKPAVKAKDKQSENVFKIKKKKNFHSLISYLSVMTKTMIKEEFKKINTTMKTPAEKNVSENNAPVKETEKNEKQVIVLNNSNSMDSSQLTLPNQSGCIIINTAPGTVFHMAPPSSKLEEPNPTPGTSKHLPRLSTNTEFREVCTKDDDKYQPKHFPPTAHEFKKKKKSSNKLISKDLFESDDDTQNDQQTRQLRTSPRTSLSYDEDRCSSVEPERFHKHSDNRRAGKYNLKNDQRSCKPRDEVSEEIEVERVSKCIDSKIRQSENKKIDSKSCRSRQSPRTSLSFKKDHRKEKIKKTLSAETVDSDSDSCRSDKSNLNIDQVTCRSRRKPNMISPGKRDRHISEDNCSVTLERVDKNSDLKKTISNTERKTSSAKQSPRTSFSDKNDCGINRKNSLSEEQRTDMGFVSEFSTKIKGAQVNDKQSCGLRSFSDTEDQHISENDDPVELEKDIHKPEKNKRKRKFSESPLSKINIQRGMSCKSNIKSGQLSSSFGNPNNSCVEFAQTNADVIDPPHKKSLILSGPSVNIDNYGQKNHLLKSKKRISLFTSKKDHIETAQPIHEDKETCQRVTRQTKTFDNPAQLLASPCQRLASVSRLSSNCNITEGGSPSSKRLKIDDAHDFPHMKIANSTIENPCGNIVTNIDIDNVKKLENAKIIMSNLQISKSIQERAFIRKKIPEILKRPPEPEIPVIPDTMQEPTNKDNYSSSNVRDTQTITEIPLNVINAPATGLKTNVNQHVNNSLNMKQTVRISDENNEDVGNPIFKSMLVNYIQEKKSRKRAPPAFCKPEKLCEKLEKYLASQYSEGNLDEFVESVYDEQVEDVGCAIVEFLSNHNRHKDAPVGMNSWAQSSVPNQFQTRLLNLLNRLHNSPPPHYETSLIELVMRGIEYQTFRLNNTPHVVSLKILTGFYALLCKLTKQKDRLMIFCMDALYCLSFSAAPVVFCALQSWPNLFPHSNSLAAKDPLMIVIVHFLLSHFSTKSLYCAEPLKVLLFKKYGYATGTITDDEILKLLLNRVKYNVSSPYNESVSMAFVLLGKRLGVEWCHKHIIQNGLLPRLLDESGSPHSRAMAAHLIGPLVRPFSNTMHLHLQVITKIYENRMQHGDEPLVEDALISSMTYFTKTNLSLISSIMKWHPKQPVSEHTRSLLHELLCFRTHGQWNRLIKTNSKKWGVQMYSKNINNIRHGKIQDNEMDVNL